MLTAKVTLHFKCTLDYHQMKRDLLLVSSGYWLWSLFNLTVIIRDSAFDVRDGGNFVCLWYNFALDYLLVQRMKHFQLLIGCKVVGIVMLIVWQLQFPVLVDEQSLLIVYYISLGLFGLSQVVLGRCCWIKHKQLSTSDFMLHTIELNELQLASDQPMEGL